MTRPTYPPVVLAFVLGLAVLLGPRVPVSNAAVPPPDGLDCETQPCSTVLPGAVRFEPLPDHPWQQGIAADGEPVGWVVLSKDVVDIPAYSGKPLITLVGLGLEGEITGAKVIHHAEPILLLGIPEKALSDFVAAYTGKPAITRIVVGSSPDPEAEAVDVISGATVTALAQNQTILDAARLMGIAVGVVAPTAVNPGAFVELDERWSWEKMRDEAVFGHLLVSQEQMGETDPEGRPFIEMWFGLIDAPQVGAALMGERDFTWKRGELEEGQHLFVVLGRGSNSFKGSGFVRGGLFDRVRVDQGLRSLMFRDTDYYNLDHISLPGAPAFDEAAVFITRGAHIDPAAPFELLFTGSRYDGEGGFSREFRAFSSSHRTPKSVYFSEGGDQEIWHQAWYNQRYRVLLLGLLLILIAGVFAFRRFTTAKMVRLERLHLGLLVASFLIGGLYLHAQPSVTQVLTVVDSVAGEWRWGLFLSEPLLFVSWIFIAIVTVIWGRGVFCGWACPYGALTELLFKLGRFIKLPQYELPPAIHERMRYLRYVILFALIPTYLYSAQLGEMLAEIEPFKTTFFVAPWSRQLPLLLWWLVLLGASVFWFRPFCRYLCPLGAALALPSSFRLSGPYRRDFCSKCTICTKGCEPMAIRKDGTIDPRECLGCMECEANWRDDEVCPPLVSEARKRKARGATPATAAVIALLSLLGAGDAVAQDTATQEANARDAAVVSPLQASIDAAAEGAEFTLPSGRIEAHLIIRKALHLRGANTVLDGGELGTVLTIDAPGVVVENLRIENSGKDLATSDSCVYVTQKASGVELRDLHLKGCAFGIWVNKTRGARIEDNRIEGTALGNRSNRGNGIHLFDASELLLRGNHVTDGRDGIYVSAVEHSRIEKNRFTGTRYGVHYMFSYDNELVGNIAEGNSAGFAIMESRGLLVEDNVARNNEGHGILFRDVQYSRIRNNELRGNHNGFFFYSSTENEITGNRLVENEVGAKIWAGSKRNRVSRNLFAANRQQIFYVSTIDLHFGVGSVGNIFSDYMGWDQDGDGVGDRPYRVNGFSSHLVYRFPAAVLLLRSPALELLSHLQSQLPLLRVATVIDFAPLVPGGAL